MRVVGIFEMEIVWMVPADGKQLTEEAKFEILMW
jgi:hypothetical protein